MDKEGFLIRLEQNVDELMQGGSPRGVMIGVDTALHSFGFISPIPQNGESGAFQTLILKVTHINQDFWYRGLADEQTAATAIGYAFHEYQLSKEPSQTLVFSIAS